MAAAFVRPRLMSCVVFKSLKTSFKTSTRRSEARVTIFSNPQFGTLNCTAPSCTHTFMRLRMHHACFDQDGGQLFQSLAHLPGAPRHHGQASADEKWCFVFQNPPRPLSVFAGYRLNGWLWHILCQLFFKKHNKVQIFVWPIHNCTSYNIKTTVT